MALERSMPDEHLGDVLRVAFEGGLPVGRFGALFHVLCLEEPATRLEWTVVGFPTLSGVLLDGADVGLFTSPPLTEGLSALTLDESPMFVAMAVGHPLARLGRGARGGHPRRAVPRRSGPAPRLAGLLDAGCGARRAAEALRREAANAEDGLALVVSGRAIATVAGWVPDGLAHPGVIAVPLVDGPRVATRLVWRSGDDRPIVRALLGLARAWTGERRRNGGGAESRLADPPAPALRFRPDRPPPAAAIQRTGDVVIQTCISRMMLACSPRLPGRKIRGALERSGDCFVPS
jgi:DNA-binding transcriptional LysR family regulator